jgi:sugar phosphate isomerase/epimerase
VYDAIRLIDELGRDNLGIQPDVFHMNISESSITDALRAAGRRIKVIHMNETNHHRLGAGHADFTAIVQTLKEIDFDGYVSVYMPLVSQEVFQSSPAGYGRSAPGMPPLSQRPDFRGVLNEQLRFLKKIEQVVDAQRLHQDTGTPAKPLR